MTELQIQQFKTLILSVSAMHVNVQIQLLAKGPPYIFLNDAKDV